MIEEKESITDIPGASGMDVENFLVPSINICANWFVVSRMKAT